LRCVVIRKARTIKRQAVTKSAEHKTSSTFGSADVQSVMLPRYPAEVKERPYFRAQRLRLLAEEMADPDRTGSTAEDIPRQFRAGIESARDV